MNKIGTEARNREVGQAARNPAEARSNGFNRQFECDHRDRACDHRHDGSGNTVRKRAAYQKRHQGADAENCRGVRQSMKIGCYAFHAQPEHSGNLIDPQSKEIFDLRTRDQNRDSIGETDHDGPRDELHCRAHSRDSENDEQNSGHHGTHEQSVHTVHGYNSRDHHNERARRTADLGL